MKRTHRFFLEPLEARIAPATLTWDGSAGNGNWFTAANWDGNAVPGPADIAVLDIASTIDLTANATVGAFVLSDGVFTGTANLTVTGNLTWTGGTMEGAGTTSIAGAGSTISGASAMRLSRILSNSGTLTYSSGDADAGLQFGVVADAPGELRNTAAGTVNVTAGGDITEFFDDPGHRIVNAGTWNVSGVGFESVVGSGVVFDNTGTVNVLSGTASFASGGTHSGAWTTAATHTLRFAAGDHLFNAGSTLSGVGTMEVSGGLFDFNAGTFNLGRVLVSGGEARFDAAATTSALEISSGTQSGAANLTVTGNLTWTGGTMEGAGTTSIAGAGSTISGASAMRLSRILSNSGTLTYSSGDADAGLQFGVVADAPGELRNTAAGTVNVTAGGDITEFFDDPGHRIVNAGTWNVSGVGFESAVGLGVIFDNTGTVNVLSGTASFAGGGTHTGAWTAAATHTLRFAGSDHAFNTGSTLSGVGTMEVSGGLFDFNAGTFNLGRVLVSGGEARFDAAATTSALEISSGTQSGAANLTVTGNLTWTGGTMEGAGTTSIAGAGSTISGASAMRLSRILSNSGTLTYSSADADAGLQFGAVAGAPGELRNTAAGTVNVTAGGDITEFFDDPGHRIVNAGTWNVSGVGFESAVGLGVIFDNTGTVNVLSGTASFAGGGTHTGAWTAAATHTLRFAGSDHAFNTGSTLSGVGTMEVSGGLFDFNAGTFNLGRVLVSGGEARFDAAATTSALEISSGTQSGAANLTVTGNLTWTGGTMEGAGTTSIAGAGSTISGASAMRLSRILSNSGTLTYSSADADAGLQFGVVTGAPGELRNTAAGTVNVTAGGDLVAFFDDPAHRITNAGTWNVSGASFESAVGVIFDNTGTLNLLSGTAIFSGGGTHTGAWTAAATHTLRFAGGDHLFGAGSTLNVVGTLEVTAGLFDFNAGIFNVTGTTQINGGTASFDAAASTTTLNVTGGTQSGTATLTVTGNLGWSGGTLAGTGTTVVNGPISGVGGVATKFLSRRLENAGILSFVSTDTGGPVQFTGGGAAPGMIVNLAGGTVVVPTGGDFTQFGGGAHAIVNQGAWNVTGAGFTSTVAAGIAFTNTGALTAQAGTARFQGSYAQSAGSTTLAGGTITTTPGLAFTGGELSGAGTITGSVTNSGGTVRPAGASVGVLTITGNFTQGAGGALAVEINGTTAGTLHDQLAVLGTATLGGTINGTLGGGYTPAAPDVLSVVTAGVRTGTFATVNATTMLRAAYTPTQARLVFDDGISGRTFSIGDADVIEGNAGTVIARFMVTLSAPSSQTITVQYATASGTAQAPGDFTALALATLTFLPNEVSKPIDVPVLGDDLFEADERFFVNLSNPSIVTLDDAQGAGTIRNDDPRRVVPDFDAGDLDAATGFKLSGGAAGDRTGWSVSDAGDVNDDGIDDVIVGGTRAAYVVFGTRAGFASDLDLSTLDGTNGFALTGATPDDLRGLAVGGAGDVNGDGIDDVIVGASLTDGVATDTGVAYVVFGKVTPFAASVALPALNGADGFRLSGGVAGNRAGLAVGGAGDVNNDGFADVIIGGTGPATSSFGASYVFFGRSGAFPVDFDLNTLNGTAGFEILSPMTFDDDGFTVGAAGDVNGDNFDDVIFGSFGTDAAGEDSGAAYVVFGRASFLSMPQVSTLNGTNGFKISGAGIGGRAGYTVGTAGDMNSDGFDDLAISARGSGPGGAVSGAAFVLFGKASGFTANVSLGLLNGTNGFAISGVPGEDFTGTTASGAGDVNGDGFADLLVGAFAVDANGADSGASYLVYGKPGGYAAAFPLASLDGANGFRIGGAFGGDLFGFAVSNAGDVNGDGFADLLLGAHRADPHGTDSGASYVFYGFEAGTPQPSLSINDVSQAESDSGTTTFTFTVTLSAASNETITVQIATEDDSALAGEDYVALPATTLTFLPGELTKPVVVTVNGDTAVEPVERFRVVLSGVQNALLIDGRGDGKIRNDDFAQPNPQTLAFPEPDGDMVSVRVSGAPLLPGDVTLADDGSIEVIDLTRLAAVAFARGAKPLNVLIGVQAGDSGLSDGLTKVGLLNATGLNLGKVKLQGSLGQLFAGDSASGKAALKQLLIEGDLGGDKTTPQLTQLFGNLDRVVIKGSVKKDTVQIDGRLGALSIGGDFLGETAASAATLQAGSIGTLKIGGQMRAARLLAESFGGITIGGDLQDAGIFSQGAIKSMRVLGKMASDDPNAPVLLTARNQIGNLFINGDVENARILAGYDKDALPVNPDARIGKVIVNGHWIASSLVAGIADATSDGFGRNDAIIAGDTTPALLSKIASILIRGSATGSAAMGDHFGITAQSIGKASIAGQKLALNKTTPDDLLLDPDRSDFRLVEVV